MLRIRRAQKAAFPPEPKQIKVALPPPQPEVKTPSPTVVGDNDAEKATLIPLHIRQGQKQVFEQASLKNFEEEMVHYLKASYPEQTGTLAEKHLRAFISAGVEKAETYAVTDENDVRRFLEFLLRHNMDLELKAQASWAAGTLCDEQLNGMDKMNRIEEEELFTRRSVSA